MDKKTAKDKLRELRDSLSKVLDEKEFQSAEEIKEQSKEALGQAREANKQFKKTLIDRIKELPVVDKVSQLGTAGTVAVSSAAVVQTELAIDQTQVFIAEVANDVVEQRIEAPFFLDAFVDFYELNDWGQVVIAEKVSEAQAFVAEVSEQQPTSQQNNSSEPTKPEASSSSKDSSSDNPSDKQGNNTEPKSEEKESKVEEKSSSEKKVEEKSEEVKKEAQETQEEPKEEAKTKDTQEQQNAPEDKSEPIVDEIPLVETPIDYQNDIKPHRQVSPTN